MAPVFTSSSLKSFYGYKHAYHLKGLYQVTIEDFDGESYDYEIEAKSENEASMKAQSIAAANGIDIYNMSIYSL